MSPKINEVKEFNGVELSKCSSCGVYPKFVDQGEPADYKLIFPKCGKELSNRGANIRSMTKLAEAWNKGLTDGLIYLSWHNQGEK